MPDDMELFIGLYHTPLNNPTINQTMILELIEKSGPYTIQQIKEETGLYGLIPGWQKRSTNCLRKRLKLPLQN